MFHLIVHTLWRPGQSVKPAVQNAFLPWLMAHIAHETATGTRSLVTPASIRPWPRPACSSSCSIAVTHDNGCKGEQVDERGCGRDCGRDRGSHSLRPHCRSEVPPSMTISLQTTYIIIVLALCLQPIHKDPHWLLEGETQHPKTQISNHHARSRHRQWHTAGRTAQ
jgi:hypothetical protein